jgi:hypothetical protein
VGGKKGSNAVSVSGTLTVLVLIQAEKRKHTEPAVDTPAPARCKVDAIEEVSDKGSDDDDSIQSSGSSESSAPKKSSKKSKKSHKHKKRKKHE